MNCFTLVVVVGRPYDSRPYKTFLRAGLDWEDRLLEVSRQRNRYATNLWKS
jgi:hypothetical protein